MFSLSSGFEEFALEHGSRIQRQLQNALMLKYRRQSLYALVRLKEDSPLDPLISHLGEGYGQTQEFHLVESHTPSQQWCKGCSDLPCRHQDPILF